MQQENRGFGPKTCVELSTANNRVNLEVLNRFWLSQASGKTAALVDTLFIAENSAKLAHRICEIINVWCLWPQSLW